MASRGRVRTGVSDGAGKPDQLGIESAVPRGALCLSRARRAISRAEASRDTLRARTETRRARVLRSRSVSTHQGHKAPARSAAAARRTRAAMVKQRRRSAAAVGFQNIEGGAQRSA